MARRAYNLRIGDAWVDDPESPVEVVGKIAPTPLLIVHGRDDHYFGIDHAQALYAAAGQPSELWLVDGFGHAEAGASPELLDPHRRPRRGHARPRRGGHRHVTEVTVRFWAAAREAAGQAEELYPAGTLADVVTRGRPYGTATGCGGPGRCSFLVDGEPVGKREPRGGRLLGEGAVLEVLPPFAGG